MTSIIRTGITALAALLQEKVENGYDILPLLKELQPILLPPHFAELAFSFDICPIHIRPRMTCLDYRADCLPYE